MLTDHETPAWALVTPIAPDIVTTARTRDLIIHFSFFGPDKDDLDMNLNARQGSAG